MLPNEAGDMAAVVCASSNGRHGLHDGCAKQWTQMKGVDSCPLCHLPFWDPPWVPTSAEVLRREQARLEEENDAIRRALAIEDANGQGERTDMYDDFNANFPLTERERQQQAAYAYETSGMSWDQWCNQVELDIQRGVEAQWEKCRNMENFVNHRIGGNRPSLQERNGVWNSLVEINNSLNELYNSLKVVKDAQGSIYEACRTALAALPSPIRLKERCERQNASQVEHYVWIKDAINRAYAWLDEIRDVVEQWTRARRQRMRDNDEDEEENNRVRQYQARE